ncbi:MAG: DUF3431 domain-containing protein [Spirosomaceae bacterium]|nr:DUF3431 domain-containing protein [Spirosomataceae bacterium]
MTFHLVVARYLENLNWLRRIPKNIEPWVYNKGNDDLYPATVVLPNVGREAHTYLHHIVNQYDTLPDYTFFCQAKPFDHAYDFHHSLRHWAAQADHKPLFQWFGHIIDTDTPDGLLFQTWSKNEDQRHLDLAGFCRELFDEEPPAAFPFVLGAQFVVARALIRARPLSFYEKALQLTQTFPDAAHCFERTWDKVFGVEGIDKEWLAGRKTVFLKPIKAK